LVLNKTIFGIASIAALMATPVLAADMPVKASPRAPVVTTWTGCYVNGGVGYGVNNQDHFGFNATGANPNETSAGRGYSGRVGGGCDYQFSPGSGWGNWVVGASPILT
jgi:outer membrane immunogenic protein